MRYLRSAAALNDYERKFQAALVELAASGIWPSNYFPPVTRGMRKLGLHPRPPHYAPLVSVVCGFALWFAPVWGTLMWFAQWRAEGFSVALAIGLAGCAWLLFGALMALYYEHGRRKHGLSDWSML